MNVKNYSVHILFLFCLTLLGNAVMLQPFLSVKNPILNFVISIMLTALITLICLPVINNLKGIWFYIVSWVTVLTALYGAVSSVADYISFLGGNKLLLSLPFLVLTAALTLCGISAFLKFSLLFGVITAAIIPLLFVMSMGDYDYSFIKQLPLEFNFKNAAIYFLKYFSPIISCLMLTRLCCYKQRVKNALSAVFLAGVLMAFCLLQTVFMLGNTAADYKYPYLAAVSAYSSGQLYIRQDGFVWFVFFAVSATKTALCTKTIYMILKYKKGNQI